MRRIPSPVLLLAAALLIGSCRNAGFPEVPGWTQAGEVSVYDADNLWEYIDGAAELFVTYGIRTCRTADLASGEVTVTVDLYEMCTPLDAFGIFNLEGSGRGAPFPDAVEAVIDPPFQALLLKGAVYVKVNVVEGELTDSTGRGLLEGIAQALPGPATYPAELEFLPRPGRVAGSEGYQAGGFLGLTELTHCIYAEYTSDGGGTWQGFLIRSSPGSPDPWTELAARWDALEHDGRTVLYREVPYRGLVGLVRTDRGILGVSGAADQAELLRRLDGFLF